jgi:D-glycero-D-manno-heptose 1,7-bisphosphate phosphatase
MIHQLKLVILDRDGVINHDSPHYIKSPEEWHAIDGSLEAIAKLNQAGIKVGIATNQSGVARGYYTLEALNNIHQKMKRELEHYHGHIDQLEFCSHHPDENCECRKPKAGMLIKICHDLNISFHETVMMGDSKRDIEAAEVIGVRGIRIGKDKEYSNLQEAVNALLSK